MLDAAKAAESTIHPMMLRGDSNKCESKFHVLTKFRSKDKNLQQRSYSFFTDLGLLQGNMTWAYGAYGENYHWLKVLLERLHLPIYAPLIESLLGDVRKRWADLQRKKTDEAKKGRIGRKQARAAEREDRCNWTKRQKVQHSYGVTEVDGPSETGPKRAACKSCGLDTHQRVSSKKCPNNKKL